MALNVTDVWNAFKTAWCCDRATVLKLMRADTWPDGASKECFNTPVEMMSGVRGLEPYEFSRFHAELTAIIHPEWRSKPAISDEDFRVLVMAWINNVKTHYDDYAGSRAATESRMAGVAKKAGQNTVKTRLH